MFEKIKRVGKFNNPLNKHALIKCHVCHYLWGAKKWERRCEDGKMYCPGCESVFEKDTDFAVSYTERHYQNQEPTPKIPVPAGQKATGRATVKAHDKLIRKDEQK